MPENPWEKAMGRASRVGKTLTRVQRMGGDRMIGEGKVGHDGVRVKKESWQV
jgi:hypothetical protein